MKIKRFNTFSSYNYKSKYIDITIDCAKYDDGKWEYPLTKLYDIVHSKKYEDILFVLGKSSYSRPESYCSVYEVLTDKHMLGIECSCIEPINCSNSIKENNDSIKEFKDNIVARIIELFDGSVDYSLKSNLFNRLLPICDSAISDYYTTNGENSFLNPTKRNILIMFDGCFGEVEQNIAKQICDKIIRNFVKSGNELVKDYFCNAYYYYILTKETAESLGISFEEYLNKPIQFPDDENIVNKLNKKFNVSNKVIKGCNGTLIDIVIYDPKLAKMPDGSSVPKYLEIDELCEILYIKGLPNYLDYIDCDKNFKPNSIGSMSLSNIKELCDDKRKEYEQFKARLNDKKYLISQKKYNFFEYDEKDFSKMVKDNSLVVKVSYTDNNKVVLFPNVLDNIDMVKNSISNLDKLDIVDGELV